MDIHFLEADEIGTGITNNVSCLVQIQYAVRSRTMENVKRHDPNGDFLASREFGGTFLRN